MSSIPPLLVVQAQTGDREALNAVLKALQEPLYRHICSVLGTVSGAEDVLQDVLLVVARRIGTVREPQWLKAWAYRIANREAVRAAQRSRSTTLREAPLDHDLPAAAMDEHPDDELLRSLPSLVDGLSPAAATVVRMHYLEELSAPEIAAALEIPVGTVKSRLAYGLATLRRTLAAGNAGE